MMYACTSWCWLGPLPIGSLYHCTWFARAYLQDRAVAHISTLPLVGFMESTSEIHNSFEIFLWRSFWTSIQNSSPYPTLHMISHPLGSFHLFDVWGNTKPHTIHCCVEWKCWILDVTDFYSAWFASIIHILHACSPRSEVVIVSDFPSFSNLGDFDVPSVSVDLVALASPVL